MPEQPIIAVFAESRAVSAYLGEIVALAGGAALILDKKPLESAMVLGTGDDMRKVPRHPGQPLLWLGEGAEQGSVRFVKTPVRAAQTIAAIHKILGAQETLPVRMEIAGHAIDTRENLWLRDGEPPVRLTEKEIAILVLLKESAPSKVSRQTMLDKVWAYADGVETHTLETHIYRLRQKIETDPSSPQILLTAEDGYRLGK